MYILCEFNKNKYYLSKVLNEAMAKNIISVYRFFCPDIKIYWADVKSGCYSQEQFIKDYKSTNHLTSQIEHLPLDKA